MIRRDGNCIGLCRRLAAFAMLAFMAAGCSESADDAVARRKKELNVPDTKLTKFSGTVTVDGQTREPQKGHELLVCLYDPQKPPAPGKPTRYSVCQTGKFQFSDVPSGSYVVLFAELKSGRPGIFRGPDLLTNLYNDPDKNASREGFKVDLSGPGKTADFNLEVAGKDPVTTPGEHAVLKTGQGR